MLGLEVKYKSLRAILNFYANVICFNLLESYDLSL